MLLKPSLKLAGSSVFYHWVSSSSGLRGKGFNTLNHLAGPLYWSFRILSLLAYVNYTQWGFVMTFVYLYMRYLTYSYHPLLSLSHSAHCLPLPNQFPFYFSCLFYNSLSLFKVRFPQGGKGSFKEHGQLINGYVITEEYFLLSNSNGLYSDFLGLTPHGLFPLGHNWLAQSCADLRQTASC